MLGIFSLSYYSLHHTNWIMMQWTAAINCLIILNNNYIITIGIIVNIIMFMQTKYFGYLLGILIVKWFKKVDYGGF